MLPGGAPCVVQLFLKALYSLKEISDAKLAYGQLFCVRSTSDKLLNPPRKSFFCAFSDRLPENMRKRSGEMLFRKGREGLQKKRENFFFRKQYITQGKNSQEKAGRIRRKRSEKNNTTEKTKRCAGEGRVGAIWFPTSPNSREAVPAGNRRTKGQKTRRHPLVAYSRREKVCRFPWETVGAESSTKANALFLCLLL